MAELQRSVQTFRRSGSSGLQWGETSLAGDKLGQEGGGGEVELLRSRSVGTSSGTADSSRRCRERDHDGGRQPAFRTRGPISPAEDPPSPGVGGCVLCVIFAKPSKRKQPSNPKRR
ncbi:uncharacterized protein At1g15400-like [Zingiber officinale]|uniref:Uncharacterized protein n=1 Tax=Zingiber officinale TaxID=94328 RepID=A0A8J5FXH5_ZINOF|nr:uncharacterized protein At1g15400-like [Zingiber officinale]XP_042405034.1 uncharacterized protein At1g15400-like [Zingiber officinale]KAG6497630.1 hypothetical protein ZIOFF_045534 [Zingiber officinale]KAG6501600.1 hypothetical protein ZIOFF_041483 [Zingiber officinale]